MAKIKVYQTKKCMGIVGMKVCNNPPTTYEMRGGERFYTCPGCAPNMARAIDKAAAKVRPVDPLPGSAIPRNLDQPGVIETIFTPENNKYYHISRGEDLIVYCDCPNWKYSQNEPKTCTHLLERGYYVRCGMCGATFANGVGHPPHLCQDDFPEDEDGE